LDRLYAVFLYNIILAHKWN